MYSTFFDYEHCVFLDDSVISTARIPLVQRGAPISIAVEEGGKGKKGKAAPAVGTESPTQDPNPEEKTVTEAFNFATK